MLPIDERSGYLPRPLFPEESRPIMIAAVARNP
ncbi:hypothetical protein KL86PLE_130066 [uncultured Pleomorphomonas sp.]|uniref:Uncharacterized protein n=1 Tax=uncultured Pleomorphomonas sp. TaxID=442121 RepID=A0A212L910_9HYPH|nr:hypothetical protein KL86PLE_130066 [uncultured Pleomorphomonas sp.]